MRQWGDFYVYLLDLYFPICIHFLVRVPRFEAAWVPKIRENARLSATSQMEVLPSDMGEILTRHKKSEIYPTPSMDLIARKQTHKSVTSDHSAQPPA